VIGLLAPKNLGDRKAGSRNPRAIECEAGIVIISRATYGDVSPSPTPVIPSSV